MTLAQLLSTSVDFNKILQEINGMQKYMTQAEKERVVALVTEAMKIKESICPCTDSECRLDHICDCDRDAWQHAHLVSDHNGHGRQR